MIEIKAVWSGWSGGPGYTTFYGGADDTALGAANFQAAVGDFFDAIANLIPTGITVTVENSYRVLNVATGQLISESSTPGNPRVTAGTGNAAFAAVAGMCVNWLTGVSAGRRLRVGRTYLIPLTAFIWQTDGTVTDTVVSEVLTAANTLQQDARAALVVWKRPKGGAGGVASTVTGVRVPDEGVILRSRRR